MEEIPFLSVLISSSIIAAATLQGREKLSRLQVIPTSCKWYAVWKKQAYLEASIIKQSIHAPREILLSPGFAKESIPAPSSCTCRPSQGNSAVCSSVSSSAFIASPLASDGNAVVCRRFSFSVWPIASCCVDFLFFDRFHSTIAAIATMTTMPATAMATPMPALAPMLYSASRFELFLGLEELAGLAAAVFIDAVLDDSGLLEVTLLVPLVVLLWRVDDVVVSAGIELHWDEDSAEKVSDVTEPLQP